MPATRQRTENWRQCLWQIFERNGALEISLPNAQSGPDSKTGAECGGMSPANLIWRVKILGIKDDELLVDLPYALGKTLDLEDGIELVAAIVVGQNRWMFNTSVLGHVKQGAKSRRPSIALRLHLPSKVERCGRRNAHRISTMELTLPRVRCWSLIDPASAAVAELANEELVRRVTDSKDDGGSADLHNEFVEQLALPEVGPPFDGELANLGGGGIGIIVDRDSASALTSNRIFYLQFALPPEIPVPLAVTAKLVHTHIDSMQRTYAGLAFDFSRNKGHEKFIAEQLERYVNLRQEAQQRRRAA